MWIVGETGNTRTGIRSLHGNLLQKVKYTYNYQDWNKKLF